jgi:hypothetical protein
MRGDRKLRSAYGGKGTFLQNANAPRYLIKKRASWCTCDKAGCIEKDMFIFEHVFFLALLQHM